VAGSFLDQIQRAKAATQSTRPAEKDVTEMTPAELDAALVEAKREAIEANRALADAVAAERNRPAGTLGARLAELQRHKRKTWR